MKHIKINDIVKDLSDIEGLVTDDSAYPLLTVKFPNGGHRMLSADKLTLVEEIAYPDAQKSAIIGYYRQGATIEEIKYITDLTVYEIRRIIDTYLLWNI